MIRLKFFRGTEDRGAVPRPLGRARCAARRRSGRSLRSVGSSSIWGAGSSFYLYAVRDAAGLTGAAKWRCSESCRLQVGPGRKNVARAARTRARHTRGLPRAMASVNELLMDRGYGQYIWAFASQGFEGRECLRELISLDEAGLDRLAVQTLRNAERALGVVPAASDPDEETRFVTSLLPGLYIEIPEHRLGRAKGKTFTEYAVDVYTVDGQRAAQTWHRYSEFEDLRKRMEKQVASKQETAGLPKLPKKKAVGSQSELVVTEREQQLRVFLERMRVDSPKACRELLDEFLGIKGVEIRAPEPPPSPQVVAAEAVAVKLPPKLQQLADKLGLEREEVDEILESVDHDVEEATSFLREEYSDQLEGEEEVGSDEGGSEDDSGADFDAGTDKFRDSIDDLGGGWGDQAFDARGTTTEFLVTTIDVADRKQVEDGPPRVFLKLVISRDYFSEDVEHQSWKEETTGHVYEQIPGKIEEAEAEPEPELPRIDLEGGLRALRLDQYASVLLEYEFDDPSLWADFDDEEWADMFEMMDVDSSHRKVLQGWFTNPAAQALIASAGSADTRGSEGSLSPVRGWSGSQHSGQESPLQSPHSGAGAGAGAGALGGAGGFGSPLRMQHSSSDESVPPQAASPRRHDDRSPSADSRPKRPKSQTRPMYRNFTMPDLAPRAPLQPEPDRGFGDGFFPGAALPKPRRTSERISLDGGGASSGPLFSVVYTEDGVTHAWSEAGAGEMRSACSNPRLTTGREPNVAEMEAADAVWSTERLHNRTERRASRQGIPYKLVNDAHSQTIGPNVNVCISKLIESYQQETETLQVLQGIVASEKLASVRRRDLYRRGAVLSSPSQVPRITNGWASGPLCATSLLPLKTAAATDGSEAVLSSRSKCVREAHIELLSSRTQYSEEGRPDAAVGTAPTSRVEIAERFKTEIAAMKEAEEDGQIDLLAEVEGLEGEIEQLKTDFLAASDEDKQNMAADLRVTRDSLMDALAQAKRDAVLSKATARESLDQRTRLMRAKMEAFDMERRAAAERAAAAQSGPVGPVLEAAAAAFDAKRDPRQQLAAWRQAADEKRELATSSPTADTEEPGISQGTLNELNRVFAELAEDTSAYAPKGFYDLKEAKMLPLVPPDLTDTGDWAESAGAVEEADWSALLGEA